MQTNANTLLDPGSNFNKRMVELGSTTIVSQAILQDLYRFVRNLGVGACYCVALGCTGGFGALSWTGWVPALHFVVTALSTQIIRSSYEASGSTFRDDSFCSDFTLGCVLPLQNPTRHHSQNAHPNPFI